MTVERLDFSKPPLGYCIVRGGVGYIFFDKEGGRHQASMHDLGHDWRQEKAQSVAWAHHKARHDPPGLRVFRDALGGTVYWFGDDGRGYQCFSSRTDARAAAWAWYERRLALADKIELGDHLATDVWIRVRFAIGACPSSTPLWPRALTWSDADCDAVERWLADPTAELPEVLRG